MKDDAEAGRRTNLKRLLTPRHIAFVGGRAIEACINATRKSGFTGTIWAVHPKYPELAGVACVASLADLSEPPDAALIAVSRERTVDVVAELNAMGAGGAVSIVGEFAETGEDGAALQARLVAAAGELDPACVIQAACDVTDDCVFDDRDAQLLLKWSAANTYDGRADLDDNGRLNVSDVLRCAHLNR